MKRKRIEITLLSLPLLSFLIFLSCDLIDYHPLDGNVNLKKDGGENPRNEMFVDWRCSYKDSIRFVFVGDTHRNDKETEAFVNHVNQREDIDFVLHAGDMTDFGYKKEFEWSYKLLKSLKIPHFVLIGNHDIPAYGDLVYESVYGPLNFSFIAGKYKFIAVNTNKMEYDKPMDIPDFNFLEKETADCEQYIGTIVVMHAPPGCDQFEEEELIERFSGKLTAIPNLYVCLHGHTHKHHDTELLNDGIRYIGCDNIEKRTYLIFEMTPKGFTYEVVNF